MVQMIGEKKRYHRTRPSTWLATNEGGRPEAVF
jgi:hypothetical protein